VRLGERRFSIPDRLVTWNGPASGSPDGVTALRAYLDRIWDQALTAYQKTDQAAPVDPEQEDR
jgi:hypothetical protein